MKTPRADAPAAEGGLIQSWIRFWFTPTDPLVLHGVRLLTGLLLLVWLLTLMNHRHALFGRDGFFDQRAYVEAQRLPGGSPQPLSWSLTYLADSPAKLEAFYWGSVAIIALFALGVLPRLTGILTWLAVASFTTTPIAFSDADPLLLLLAFYLMVGYVLLGSPRGSSWLSKVFGPVLAWPLRGTSAEGAESVGANVAVRLLQVHLAVVIVISGLHKLQFGDWWAGLALWYPLHPPMETTLVEARRHVGDRESFLAMLNIAGYAALAWQIGFPLYAWRPRWRWVLIGGALIGWLTMAFTYQVPLFGEAMFIGLLAFCSPAGVRKLFGRLRRSPATATQAVGAPRSDRSVHVMGAS